MRPTANLSTLKGSHFPGISCDPFWVEYLIGGWRSVGGAALAHGYCLSAFQAEAAHNAKSSNLPEPTRTAAR